ncbi:MAG: SDR family NAD(P)-dependent oxidoreductase [Cyanobacteria bacterium P01_F01_bin.143]
MNLNGKQIIITGGSSSIGLAMARSLGAKGTRVVITGRDQNKSDFNQEVNNEQKNNT